MTKRYVWLLISLCFLAAAAFGQTSYVFQFPGQTGLTTEIDGKGDNDFSRFISTAKGPVKSFAALATPNGNKFYILSPGGVSSASATLSTLTPLSAISGTPSAAAVTPDGRYLFVIADHLYVVDTATDGVISTATDAGVPPGNTAIGIAFSHDGKLAWVLSNAHSAGKVDAVDLTTLQATGELSLPSAGSSIVLSPGNLLYVSALAPAVFEIDPTSLSLTSTGTIQLQGGLPGALQFTPDGSAAFFLNSSSCIFVACPPLLKYDVATHTLSGWLPPDGSAPPAFDQVLIAGNSRIFAFTSATSQLWDVTPTPLSVTKTVFSFAVSASHVKAVAVSNERPSARYLYLSTDDLSMYRVNLGPDTIGATSTLDPLSFTILSFVPIPAKSGASSLFQINSNRTVKPGATVTLSGQVLDAVGHPVFGASASFSAPNCPGATIPNPSVTTTADGWAQTVITAPLVNGTCTVTLTSGSLAADFQLTVGGGTNGGGTGGGGGTPQMILLSGDGQLLRQSQSTLETQQPLKVQVIDPAGNPVANVPVGFSVAGPGNVYTAQTTTGADGVAATDFNSGSLDGFPFLLTKVTASSTYGTVEFYIMTQDAKINDLHAPQVNLTVPTNGTSITIAEGEVKPAAIQALTISERTAGPIPNVGIRMADLNKPVNPSTVVSCVDPISTRGDNNGISRCNLKAACELNAALPANFGTIVEVGEYQYFQILVTVTKGKPSLLTALSPTSQTGNPGDAFLLKAQVTDGCQHPATNFAGLSWAIQGAGALSQTQTSSDFAGNVTTIVTLGSTAGNVTVQLSGPGLTPLQFNLTTQVLVNSVSVVAPLPDPVTVGQTFAKPVIFVVRGSNNNPLSGINVTFQATTGVTVNPASATTDAQGHVQTTVTAGSAPGNIVVTATAFTVTATANLVVNAPGPTLTSASFTNAASGAGGMTPCGLVTVAGSGIAPGIQGVLSGVTFFGSLPYILGGLSITVQQGTNTIPVPIHSIANDQFGQRANFQAPCELTAGSATVTVTVNGANTKISGVPVFAIQPGIFTFTGPNNKLYGGVIRESDGTYVTPANPARLGEKCYVVVTGLGQVTPTAVTNSVGTGKQDTNIPTLLFLNGSGIGAISSRYLFGTVGAYLVEFQIPADAKAGPDQTLLVVGLVNDGKDFVVGNTVLLPGVIAVP